MVTDRVEVPVIVVGGGPAGLTASLLLSHHGIDSVLVERHTASSRLPRARGVHARAMEILRGCGVEADMRRVALPIRSGGEWRPTLDGPLRNEVTFGGADEPEVSPCDGVAVSQDVFESVLRDHARSSSKAQLLMGTELLHLAVRPEAVMAVIVDRASGHRTEIRAQYLIAADGAHSRIREQLGIAMVGAADLGGNTMIAFRADLTPWATPRPRGIYFLTAMPAALFWTHDDDRWVLSVPDHGRPVDIVDPAATVRRAVGDSGVALEVLAVRRWTAAAQTAAHFAQGRVFLVGDAAHQVPPLGATGVSSAMHDVHNLVWKLAAVLKSAAGPGLLATYDAERRAEARQTTEDMRTAWLAFWQDGAGAPPRRSMRQIDMGFRYTSSAVLPDGSTEDTAHGDYQPSAAPGSRAPHLWLDPHRRRSTIDLFDRAPVLLTGPAARAWQTAAVSLPALKTYVIEASEWPETYGVGVGGAVLVRPDGHVAWRSATPPEDTQHPADQLAATLRSVYDQQPPPESAGQLRGGEPAAQMVHRTRSRT